ncbi:MAG: poly(A) polymerase [Pelagibacterales bacterium]|nr:poly(A) polymerase [Pelagibacterales bacterium]
MITFLNKLFLKSKNFDYIYLAFQKLSQETEVKKIFKAIEEFSDTSEIRYVGGCVRKILKHEEVDDIDLAVNLKPAEVSKILEANNIKFYDTGIEHGTITAIINQKTFEITSLREDISTDGRHAKIKFSNDWSLDSSRRDFSINSIYADLNGNLFDPFNGKNDLENGEVKFIGDPEKRIKEDYLRILRYVRFFLNYSNNNHNTDVTNSIKKNLNGFANISSERLLDEFRKLIKSKGFAKLTKDSFCSEIINLIFPQFKEINIFNNLNVNKKKIFNKLDFIMLIALMVIDGSDNVEYFLYKFNLSKNDQKRLKFLNNFFSIKINKKTFSEANLWKIFYKSGKQFLLDLLNFELFRSKKMEKQLLVMIKLFEDKNPPKFPVKAKTLMTKYNIPEGEKLGLNLKAIEQKWVDNNFKISDKEIDKIVLD